MGTTKKETTLNTEFGKHGVTITPYDWADMAYVEHVLGLKEAGDVIQLVRMAAEMTEIDSGEYEEGFPEIQTVHLHESVLPQHTKLLEEKLVAQHTRHIELLTSIVNKLSPGAIPSLQSETMVLNSIIAVKDNYDLLLGCLTEVLQVVESRAITPGHVQRWSGILKDVQTPERSVNTCDMTDYKAIYNRMLLTLKQLMLGREIKTPFDAELFKFTHLEEWR